MGLCVLLRGRFYGKIWCAKYFKIFLLHAMKNQYSSNMAEYSREDLLKSDIFTSSKIRIYVFPLDTVPAGLFQSAVDILSESFFKISHSEHAHLHPMKHFSNTVMYMHIY